MGKILVSLAFATTLVELSFTDPPLASLRLMVKPVVTDEPGAP